MGYGALYWRSNTKLSHSLAVCRKDVKEMRSLALVLPIMLIVGAVAMWMLHRDYSILDYQTRVLISAGAALFSGIISFILFKTGKTNNE